MCSSNIAFLVSALITTLLIAIRTNRVPFSRNLYGFSIASSRPVGLRSPWFVPHEQNKDAPRRRRVRLRCPAAFRRRTVAPNCRGAGAVRARGRTAGTNGNAPHGRDGVRVATLEQFRCHIRTVRSPSN
jgi:hypothetical protein